MITSEKALLLFFKIITCIGVTCLTILMVFLSALLIYQAISGEM